MAASFQVLVIIVNAIPEIIHVFKLELDVLAEIDMRIQGIRQRDGIAFVAHDRIAVRYHMLRVVSVEGENLHEVKMIS